MPHIAIKMLRGRTEEQKTAAAEAVKNALCSTLKIGEQHVSVTVEDYTPQEWQDVFKSEITDKPEKLYIKPAYDPKSLL